jgi:hypothetical protein
LRTFEGRRIPPPDLLQELPILLKLQRVGQGPVQRDQDGWRDVACRVPALDHDVMRG